MKVFAPLDDWVIEHIAMGDGCPRNGTGRLGAEAERAVLLQGLSLTSYHFDDTLRMSCADVRMGELRAR